MQAPGRRGDPHTPRRRTVAVRPAPVRHREDPRALATHARSAMRGVDNREAVGLMSRPFIEHRAILGFRRNRTGQPFKRLVRIEAVHRVHRARRRRPGSGGCRPPRNPASRGHGHTPQWHGAPTRRGRASRQARRPRQTEKIERKDKCSSAVPHERELRVNRPACGRRTSIAPDAARPRQAAHVAQVGNPIESSSSFVLDAPQ